MWGGGGGKPGEGGGGRKMEVQNNKENWLDARIIDYIERLTHLY